MSGACTLERAQRLDAVLGLGADDELRPELRERVAQFAAQHRLVFGDHGFQWFHSISVVADGDKDAPARRPATIVRAVLSGIT